MALRKPNRALVLKIAAYSAFFTVCFLLSAYLSFPYDRVRDALVRRVAAQTAASGQPAKLSIADLGPHWLTGVSLQDVAFERPGEDKDAAPTKLHVDALTVNASLLSLLRKNVDVDFSAEAGAGSVDGSYEAAKDQPTHLEAELDELDLGKLGLGSLLGVPLAGSASGTIDVSVGEKPTETQGKVDLEVKGVKLGDGKAQVKLPGMPGGLTLETIHAGTLKLKIVIRDGIASLEQLEAKGKDLQLSGSGSVRVIHPLPQSRADLTLGAKFSDAYTHRSDKLKAAFELMKNNPLIRRATGADGLMRFRLTGPIARLRSAPAVASRLRKTIVR